MKHQTFLYLAMILMAFTGSQCKKDKNEEPQLPPETTIGAMTFGCKVNGKVFVPKDGRGRVGLFVQYVNLGDGPNGGWYLNIPATNWQPNPPEGLNIETDSLLVEEGMSYSFKNQKGSPRALYTKGSIYITLDNDGILNITKFDRVNRILSGNFSYKATNMTNGEIVNVTDGRFDILY